MPGAAFKRRIMSAGEAIAATENIPYAAVQNDMVTVTHCKQLQSLRYSQTAEVAQPSFASNLIEECSSKGTFTDQDEGDVKGAIGTLYVGEVFLFLFFVNKTNQCC